MPRSRCRFGWRHISFSRRTFFGTGFPFWLGTARWRSSNRCMSISCVCGLNKFGKCDLFMIFYLPYFIPLSTWVHDIGFRQVPQLKPCVAPSTSADFESTCLIPITTNLLTWLSSYLVCKSLLMSCARPANFIQNARGVRELYSIVATLIFACSWKH